MLVATRTLDLSTRYFWRMVGRQIDIAGTDHWLDSPTNAIEARGETFRVFTDGDGVLRTDHWLKLGRWQALQLHYRLDPD